MPASTAGNHITENFYIDEVLQLANCDVNNISIHWVKDCDLWRPRFSFHL
jgi:hypothetical protein